MKSNISVVIPLYNKEHTVSEALLSAVSQRVAPLEVLVVDDGSTDRSAEVVEALNLPTVRLIRQTNGGVSRARNRGIEEAQGEWIAFLDADDCWEADFLAEIQALIADHPACAMCATAFQVNQQGTLHEAPCPHTRGEVDFFRESAHSYIAIPSAVAIKREALLAVGGFPAGMKIGEDLYLWILLARRYPIAFSPKRLVRYRREAENRSTAIYTPEKTEFSFEKLYDPTAPLDEREFVARAALGKALILCAKGDTEAARRAIETFRFTTTYRRTLRKVQVLNRLPIGWRQPLLNLYNRLAWLIAKKGL